VIYRRRATPLHAARAAAASAWCLVLAVAGLAFEQPIVLGALLLSLVLAAAGAQVLRPVGRVLAFGVPFAFVIALVNALVVRDGLTVIWRFGTIPWLGRIDVTAEATAYGGVLGLRALVVIACFALHSAVVDPDDLLRGWRRLSFRSALTAALATRLVPVLGRDGRRLADAQRTRAGAPASRATLVRAVAAGALDRAVDVAATLEVRGYGAARRPPPLRRAWSRHDLAFAAGAIAITAITVAALVAGTARFEAYPRLEMAAGPAQAVLCLALAAAALLPFADRRGVAV
jgi:energy-coupling factor transport system permease protein